jgi:hypothetical protein
MALIDGDLRQRDILHRVRPSSSEGESFDRWLERLFRCTRFHEQVAFREGGSPGARIDLTQLNDTEEPTRSRHHRGAKGKDLADLAIRGLRLLEYNADKHQADTTGKYIKVRQGQTIMSTREVCDFVQDKVLPLRATVTDTHPPLQQAPLLVDASKGKIVILSINIGSMTVPKREQLFRHMAELKPDVVLVQDTRSEEREHAHPKTLLRDEFPGYRMATAAVLGRGEYNDKVGGQWAIYNTADYQGSNSRRLL